MAHLERILDNINDQFLALDGEWRYTYINDRVVEVTGIPKKDLLGKIIWEVFPDTVGTKFYTEVHRAVAEQTIVQFEYFYPIWQRWFENRIYPSVQGVSILITEITARKQAEAALQESEKRFRQMAETIQDVFWLWDVKTAQHLYISPAFTKIWGRSPDSIFADFNTWVETIYPEDRERIQSAIPRCIVNGSLEEEYRVLRLDGSVCWVSDRGFLIRDETGQPERIVGIAQDITERKQAEEIIKINEARLKSFVEGNIVGILFGDVYGNIREANDEFLRIVGYTREDLHAGRLRWIDITPPEWLPLDEERIAEAKTRGACTPYEKEYIHKDGSRVPVLIGYSLLGEAREESVAFILDLSDRNAAKAALQESEDRLRLALESAEMGTWDWNLKTGVLKWDENCKAMFGLPPDAEVNYEVFRAGLHPEDRDRLQQVVEWSLNPQSNGEYNTEYRTVGIEDGVERWVAAQGKAYFNSVGEAVRFIGTVLNITERKRITAEREQLLKREQAAREQAETANRIKDEFLAVLSHELRTPLNPILGWTMLLRQGKLDEQKQKQALATIERNAKLQVQLIEDLLDISRILQGKMLLDNAPINPITIIEAALETVQLAVEAKEIQIEKVLAPNVSRVFGDSSRLQQVIWNLLTNAVKFTPSGGRIEICLKQVGDRVQIRVKDTGKGINPEFLPYVFDHFRQEDSQTTRKFGGLGLGLALVRYITELHGGTVKAESPGEGRGSSFTLELPLIKNKQITNYELRITPDELQSHSLQGVRVLAVDDEADIRDLVAFILEQAGAEVRIAASASEALTILEQSLPDVLVCDIGMPNVDGYTLMRQIRKRSQLKLAQIPSLALSAYAGEINRQLALEAGFQKHVTKPVEPEELIEAIISLLN